MDDAALVLAARAGDRGALADIYDRYADRLHDHCWSVLRDRDEAADALQDAFVAAAQRLGQLRDPAKLRPWLYAIARHEALRRAAARRRQTPTADMTEVAASDGEADERLRRDEAVRLVWAAAAGLADRDRAVLDLNLRQGLEGQELADAIGVERAHAYVLLNRVRAQVERSLGALLVARYGRTECPELARLLAGWDGRFSPLVRKRVARHADRCRACSDRRRTMASPLALLSAAPLLPAPVDMRARVLDDARLAAAVSPVALRSGDGFPPSAYPRRRAQRPLGAAAALVVVVAAAVAVASRPSPRIDGPKAATEVDRTTTTTAVPSARTPLATGAVVEPAVTTTTVITTTAVAVTLPAVATPRLRTLTPELDFGATADERVLDLANDGAAPLGWTASASPAAFLVEPVGGSIPPQGTARLTVFLDRSSFPEGPVRGTLQLTSDGGAAQVVLRATVLRAPSVGRLGARQPQVATSPCSSSPTETAVQATITDERGVASATLRWLDPSGRPGSRVMTATRGGVYYSRLGPFPTAGTVVWWVEADDTLGATGRSDDRSLPVVACERP